MENESKSTIGTFALWFAGGCLVLFVCTMLGCVLGIGGLVWISQAPENVNVSIDAPVRVNVGDEVEFVVSVENTGADPIELYGMDISINYLNGVLVESVDPPFAEVNQFDTFGNGETYRTYYFYTSIAPGDTVSFTFSGTAVSPGDYSGSLDVCIDSDFSCVGNFIRTVVE